METLMALQEAQRVSGFWTLFITIIAIIAMLAMAGYFIECKGLIKKCMAIIVIFVMFFLMNVSVEHWMDKVDELTEAKEAYLEKEATFDYEGRYDRLIMDEGVEKVAFTLDNIEYITNIDSKQDCEEGIIKFKRFNNKEKSLFDQSTYTILCKEKDRD